MGHRKRQTLKIGRIITTHRYCTLIRGKTAVLVDYKRYTKGRWYCTLREGNSSNNVKGLALPAFAFVNQFLTLGGTVHPAGGMTSLGEKDAVAFRNNLEVALALGRGS